MVQLLGQASEQGYTANSVDVWADCSQAARPPQAAASASASATLAQHGDPRLSSQSISIPAVNCSTGHESSLKTRCPPAMTSFQPSPEGVNSIVQLLTSVHKPGANQSEVRSRSRSPSATVPYQCEPALLPWHLQHRWAVPV